MQNKTYEELLFYFTENKVFKASLFSIAATTVLGATIIAPSLPALQNHFLHIGHSVEILSKLILTIPALFMMLFSPIAGFMYEKFKKLNIIFISLFIWSLAGIAGFFLNNIYYILFSRSILGISAAFLMTGIGVLLADYYIGIRREKALALQGFFMAFGGGIFLILGGYLADLDWRYPFLVYFLGILILIFAFFQLFEPIKHTHNNHIKTLHPPFNFTKFLPVYIMAIFCMTCFYIAPTQLPFFMTQDLGIKQSNIGKCMAAASVAMALGSLLYPRVRKLFNIYEIFFIAFSIFGIGFACISLLHDFKSILIGFGLIGIGIGLITVNNNAWLFSLAYEYERPRAYGFLASSLFMGQFISPLLTQIFVHYIGMVKMIGVFSLMILGSGFLFLLFSLKNGGKIER
ncbi:MFS transporter [Helicobacter anatolicus]|uniref:MFS transporter n=1 Tax=Helicobacter anatolicus TaxID=2905874 RepID=UPI001E642543|nr:MFS transporter [Helicobacter anatolicus]MCE3039140.1 MFS transporter [Helicobacter anatolicus]